MPRRSTMALFAVALACCTALGIALLRHHFYLLLSAEPSSDPDVLVYRLDSVRRLLFGRDVALLINTQERVVLRLPPAGRRWGRVGVWPRDEATGDVLGDPVNGNVTDSYHFDARGVDIGYTTSAQTYTLRVEL